MEDADEAHRQQLMRLDALRGRRDEQTGISSINPSEPGTPGSRLGFPSDVYRVYNLTVSSREVIRKLNASGWFQVAQRGSHVQLKHPTRPGRVTVPHPRRDLPIGTLRSIERQSGIKFR